MNLVFRDRELLALFATVQKLERDLEGAELALNIALGERGVHVDGWGQSSITVETNAVGDLASYRKSPYVYEIVAHKVGDGDPEGGRMTVYPPLESAKIPLALFTVDRIKATAEAGEKNVAS
jgi:hypothetical protein